MKVHENIMIFSKKPGRYNPQMEVGKPYARKSKNPEGFVGKSNTHGYGMKPRTEFSNDGTRYPKSILNFSRDFSAQQQVHPTQKPLNLMEWIVNTYTNESETILDHCMGSGVTGMACKKLNRNFIGIEMDKTYFDIAESRINLITNKQ
jgi:site-specific DNA-methyltransferase (adenine-specific)